MMPPKPLEVYNFDRYSLPHRILERLRRLDGILSRIEEQERQNIIDDLSKDIESAIVDAMVAQKAKELVGKDYGIEVTSPIYDILPVLEDLNLLPGKPKKTMDAASDIARTVGELIINLNNEFCRITPDNKRNLQMVVKVLGLSEYQASIDSSNAEPVFTRRSTMLSIVRFTELFKIIHFNSAKGIDELIKKYPKVGDFLDNFDEAMNMLVALDKRSTSKYMPREFIRAYFIQLGLLEPGEGDDPHYFENPDNEPIVDIFIRIEQINVSHYKALAFLEELFSQGIKLRGQLVEYIKNLVKDKDWELRLKEANETIKIIIIKALIKEFLLDQES